MIATKMKFFMVQLLLAPFALFVALLAAEPFAMFALIIAVFSCCES